MAKRTTKPRTEYDFQSISSDSEKALDELSGIRFMMQKMLEEFAVRFFHDDTERDELMHRTHNDLNERLTALETQVQELKAGR